MYRPWMHPPKNKTTKLPKRIADELAAIALQPDALSERERKAKERRIPVERKARRKAERGAKKLERSLHRQRQSQPYQPQPRQVAQNESAKGEPTRPRRRESPQPALKSILKKPKLPDNIKVAEEGSKVFSRAPQTHRVRSAALVKDDAEIAALERKLGIRVKKNSSKVTEDGALDAWLGIRDDQDEGEFDNAKKKRKWDDADDWLKMKMNNATKMRRLDRSSSGSWDEPPSDHCSSTEATEAETGMNIDHEDQFSSSENGNDSELETEEALPESKRIRENPYIPPVSTCQMGESVQYVPPPLRMAAPSKQDDLSSLRRQAQGLLNRLTETSLIPIVSDTEQLYRGYPRHHVTSTLTNLLIDLICDRSSLLHTFIILHAAFIAALHKVIGMDFGPAILEATVNRLDDVRSNSSSSTVQHTPSTIIDHTEHTKKAVNLMSLLSELYNFQMISSTLIFDYIRLFLTRMSEPNTELLLNVMRSSGPQLRQDDPSSLRDIVLLLRQQVAGVGEANLTVRTKFMIETINDLKNNKTRPGSGSFALRSEALVRMKKALGTLNSRKLRSTEPLRVDLHDVRNSEKRGNWWLPRGVKEDNNRREREDELAAGSDASSEAIDARTMNSALGATSLLRLAKEQNMNTDVRRAIFISIMSATDHRDAHIRLTKLHLKRAQEIEIPRVLIQCAGAEQTYNPYYTLVARKLCADRRLKMAFQFGLWGLFRAMGEEYGDDDSEGDEDERRKGSYRKEEDVDTMSTRRIVNLAKMYGTLVAEGALGLVTLKILNLAYLQPKTKTFVELFFITIFLVSQRHGDDGEVRGEKTIMDIFITGVHDNFELARNIQYFLTKVVSNTDIAGSKAQNKTVKWSCRVAGEVLQRILTSEVAES